MLSRLVIYFSWSYIFLTSIHEYWKNHVFDCLDLWWQSDVSAFLKKLIYFLSNSNSFTEFCCFLSSLIMNQSSVQFSSVAQSCPTLCDPMDCSMPGFPVHNQHPEYTQSHVHWVGDAIQPSHPLSTPSPPALNLSQHQGLFHWVSSSHQVAKGLDPSVQSVLPMNIHDWFPLGWTGWMSLQSKGLSRVFSNTTVQNHQFFGTQLSLWSNSHIHMWLLEKPQLWLTKPVGKVMSLLFNMLSRLVIAFLPRSKYLLISWLQEFPSL